MGKGRIVVCLFPFLFHFSLIEMKSGDVCKNRHPFGTSSRSRFHSSFSPLFRVLFLFFRTVKKRNRKKKWCENFLMIFQAAFVIEVVDTHGPPIFLVLVLVHILFINFYLLFNSIYYLYISKFFTVSFRFSPFLSKYRVKKMSLPRKGDCAKMAIIEFVEGDDTEKDNKKANEKKREKEEEKEGDEEKKGTEMNRDDRGFESERKKENKVEN